MQKTPIELPTVPLTEKNFAHPTQISTPEVTREGDAWIVTILAPMRDMPQTITKYQGRGKDKISAVLSLLSNVRARNNAILLNVCKQIESSMPEVSRILNS